MLEEFLTALIQIEAILNLQPVCDLLTVADDLQVLTPGHFHIGKPLNLISEPSLIEIYLG